MCSMTKEELLERIFHEDYKSLKGKKLRMTRVRVPGKYVWHTLSALPRPVFIRIWGFISAFMKGKIIQGNPLA